jgi:two-component system, cell cycle sensor histidine kinase and response regulator CckA
LTDYAPRRLYGLRGTNVKDQGVEEDRVEILIVEDSPTQAEELKYTLARHGFDATIAANGVEALSMMRKRKPTMVLSDIVMPEMDGYQLCREIKNDDNLKDLHVILLTSLSDPRDVIRGLECGTDNFITKPYDEKYIISRIHYILANMHLRDVEQTQLGVEVILAGERYFIKSDRIQILNLLLSSYEAAIQKNVELTMARDELRTLSGQLEHRVTERTAELSEEIKERKRTEEALLREKSLLRCLIDSVGDLIFIKDRDGFYRCCNKASEKFIGISESEQIGKSDFDFFEREKAEEIRKIDREVFEGGKPHRTQDWVQDRNGDMLFLDTLKAPYYGPDGEVLGLVGIARDITERKRAEEAVRLTNNYNRCLIEASIDPLVTIGPDGRITDVNSATEKVTGVPRKGLIGRDFSDIFTDRELAKAGYRLCFNEGSVRDYELEIRHTDGHVTPVLFNASVYRDEKDEIVGVFAAARDMSEWKRLEQQLLKAQKMEAIGQLAGGIAQDFNNILMTIIGFGNILKMKLDDQDPMRSDIEHILAASDRASQLTRSMLAYSRKQFMTPKPVDLNDIVRNGEKFLRRVIGEGLELISTYTVRSLKVFADSALIEQVLINLAMNARDAMPTGGTMAVSTESVEIEDRLVDINEFAKKGLYAVLTFSDTGIGMDQSIMDRIFDPFFTTKEVGKGTGLGLSMVYGIVRQHDGFITCYSEQGKGTTFRIYLPIFQGEVGEGPPRQDIQMPRGRETILLAEDDPTSRSVSRHYLENVGYTVIEATDGEEAVKKFIEQREKIDLALIDVIMPKLNGREVYRRIKEIKPDIKVIFMSGYTADIIHKEEIVEEGLMVLTKPSMFKELPIKIREVLDS